MAHSDEDLMAVLLRIATAVEALQAGMERAHVDRQPQTAQRSAGTAPGQQTAQRPANAWPPGDQPTFCGYQASWGVNEAGFPSAVTGRDGIEYRRREKHGSTFYSGKDAAGAWVYAPGLSFQPGESPPAGGRWREPVGVAVVQEQTALPAAVTAEHPALIVEHDADDIPF